MSYYGLVRKFFKKSARKMCLDCKDFIKEGSKILDLGCGSGVAGREFQDFFKADLIGIDIIDQRIEKIPFKIFDGINIPFQADCFDVVLINYVLHHSQNQFALLKESKRVSRDKIIIFEDLPEGFLAKIYCTLHGLSYKLVSGDAGEKLNFKSHAEWEKIFGDLGLKILNKKRIFIPFGYFDLSKRILYILKK